MYQPRNTFDAGQSSSLPLNTAVLTFERTLDIVRRQWPLIASVVGVCLAVVVAYALTVTLLSGLMIAVYVFMLRRREAAA